MQSHHHVQRIGECEQKLVARANELAQRDAELATLRETLAAERSASEKLRREVEVRACVVCNMWCCV